MLNVHSYFSFKYGLVSIEKLIGWAITTGGYKALALTDINSTAGCLDFVRQAKKNGIRPLLGVDFRNGAVQQFTAVAKNNAGFQSINEFLSRHLHLGAAIPPYTDEIKNSFIIYPLENIPTRPLQAHEFVAIKPHQVNRARFLRPVPERKMIACPTFTLLPREADIPEERKKAHDHIYDLHCVLRAIDLNTLVTKLNPSDTAEKQDVYLTKRQLTTWYKDLPEAFENLKYVVKTSAVDFEFGPKAEPQNLKVWLNSEEEDYDKIRQICLDNLAYRYGDNPSEEVLKRLDTELHTIRQKKFLAYFLISWDIVSYARSKGYFYVGRGSGANSIVAYLMRITDVDPIELKLYFERFINLFRQNPPDFDIDFSSNERDDVTRYICERYPNATLLATHNTFQKKAVIREVGKAFGIPPYEIDRLQTKDLKDLDDHSRVILKYGEELTNLPSHLSVHAGGIIISEKPIHYFTATSLPPKDFPITHFDMHLAEDVGLFKYDILAQRGLGKIRDALAIIHQNRPGRLTIDIHNVKRFVDDPLVKSNLRKAKAIGCFYVESPAMRMLLTKLRCDDYLTLVAASSIIRPGVAKSGMMREYVQRFRVPEKRREAHPELWKIMPDTYGVMVYQEDVIKVAHQFAGLSPAESDVLRRGMSGKFRSREEFQEVKDNFFSNCQKKGHTVELAQDVWRQIESFAGYAFAKGHSASYAIESYQSLFLKSHFPLEFMVAVLNNGGGFYSPELYIHEARMHGGDIQLPCINRSDALTTIVRKTIFLGLHMIKELNDQTIIDVLYDRNKNGAFRSVDEFVKRVSVSLEQLSLLIRIGAFRFTGKGKKELLWHAHFLLGNTGKSKTGPSLFDSPVKKYELPQMSHDTIEDIYDEMELLGFPLESPFCLLESIPEGCLLAVQFGSHIGKYVKTLGYLVTVKRTRTSNGKDMYFGNFIDQQGEFIDTVHFPPIAAKYPFTGQGIYLLEGKVVEEFDAISLEISSMKRMNYKELEV